MKTLKDIQLKSTLNSFKKIMKHYKNFKNLTSSSIKDLKKFHPDAKEIIDEFETLMSECFKNMDSVEERYIQLDNEWKTDIYNKFDKTFV